MSTKLETKSSGIGISVADLPASSGNAGATLAEYTHVAYENASVTVTVNHPGGSTAELAVEPRRINAEGIIFRHRNFLHLGTRCEVGLPTLAGMHDKLPGVVSSCTYVDSRTHEFIVRFRERVDLRRYVQGQVAHRGERSIAADLGTHTGDVLHLCEEEAEQRLMVFCLRHTKLGLVQVATLGRALDELRRRRFSALICELPLQNERLSCDEVLTRIRGTGYCGPVIASIETGSARAFGPALLVGAAPLRKPYDKSTLLAKLDDLLCASAPGGQVHSTLRGDATVAELVNWYVRHVRELRSNLRRAREAEELDVARRILAVLRDTGAGYGFEVLSTRAAVALTALDATGSVGESLDGLYEVEHICDSIVEIGGKR